jgi:hypothetical protein
MPAESACPLVDVPTAWNDKEVEAKVMEILSRKPSGLTPPATRLGPYNGFSGCQRALVDRMIKVAIKERFLPFPQQCSICGAIKGRIDYHNEDYGRPFKTIAICQRCHLALHNRRRSTGWAAKWERLVKQFGDGTKWFEAIGISNSVPRT